MKTNPIKWVLVLGLGKYSIGDTPFGPDPIARFELAENGVLAFSPLGRRLAYFQNLPLMICYGKETKSETE